MCHKPSYLFSAEMGDLLKPPERNDYGAFKTQLPWLVKERSELYF